MLKMATFLQKDSKLVTPKLKLTETNDVTEKLNHKAQAYADTRAGATENARLENPAPTRRGGKRRNKLYGQPMEQFLQFIEITVSLIL